MWPSLHSPAQINCTLFSLYFTSNWKKLRHKAVTTCPILEEIGPELKPKPNILCCVMCWAGSWGKWMKGNLCGTEQCPPQSAFVSHFIHSFTQEVCHMLTFLQALVVKKWVRHHPCPPWAHIFLPPLRLQTYFSTKFTQRIYECFLFFRLCVYSSPRICMSTCRLWVSRSVVDLRFHIRNVMLLVLDHFKEQQSALQKKFLLWPLEVNPNTYSPPGWNFILVVAGQTESIHWECGIMAKSFLGDKLT